MLLKGTTVQLNIQNLSILILKSFVVCASTTPDVKLFQSFTTLLEKDLLLTNFDACCFKSLYL